MLAALAGISMILVATAVFLYYTIWTLFMPFVDENIELHNFFPPRVWAIRIPLAIVLVGVAVVGSFLSMVMIKAGQKKRAKLAAAAGVKKKT